MLLTETVSPITIPVVEPTEPIPGALLLQVPEGVISPNVVVSPEHTLNIPVIGAGSGLTVTVAVMIQPVGNV